MRHSIVGKAKRILRDDPILSMTVLVWIAHIAMISCSFHCDNRSRFGCFVAPHTVPIVYDHCAAVVLYHSSPFVVKYELVNNCCSLYYSSRKHVVCLRRWKCIRKASIALHESKRRWRCVWKALVVVVLVLCFTRCYILNIHSQCCTFLFTIHLVGMCSDICEYSCVAC